MQPRIIVHGGAGAIADALVKGHLQGCREAAEEGLRLLWEGAPAEEAVERAICLLEDDEVFDAAGRFCHRLVFGNHLDHGYGETGDDHDNRHYHDQFQQRKTRRIFVLFCHACVRYLGIIPVRNCEYCPASARAGRLSGPSIRKALCIHP